MKTYEQWVEDTYGKPYVLTAALLRLGYMTYESGLLQYHPFTVYVQQGPDKYLAWIPKQKEPA